MLGRLKNVREGAAVWTTASLGYLSFIDPEREGFGGGSINDKYPREGFEGLCPEENIITEGNISTNSPSGGSINDILYRKLKKPPSSE